MNISWIIINTQFHEGSKKAVYKLKKAVYGLKKAVYGLKQSGQLNWNVKSSTDN